MARGFEGLGVYMTRVSKAYAFDKMFAVIIFIVIISLLLMGAVNLIKTLSLPWVRVEKRKLWNKRYIWIFKISYIKITFKVIYMDI